MAKMLALPYCFSYAVALIAVGAFNNAGASPCAPTPNQELQKISDSISELVKAVSNCRSSESVLKVAKAFRSQSMSYEMVFQLGELKNRFEAAFEKIQQMEERLVQVETTSSQAKEDSPDEENKAQAPVEKVATTCKSPCRSPFYQVGQDCLYVDVAFTGTWSDCRTFCRTFGGDLAVPSDVIKVRDFLATVNKDRNYWIGASDEQEEGKWFWVNGREMDLSVGWASGQPDNSGAREHCSHYWRSRSLALNDGSCTLPMHCVCQDVGYPAEVTGVRKACN